MASKHSKKIAKKALTRDQLKNAAGGAGPVKTASVACATVGALAGSVMGILTREGMAEGAKNGAKTGAAVGAILAVGAIAQNAKKAKNS